MFARLRSYTLLSALFSLFVFATPVAAEEQPIETEENVLFPTPEAFAGAKSFAIPNYPRAWVASHHWATGRSSNGDTIDLEDGTKWEIYKGDGRLTTQWRQEHKIVIIINTDYLRHIYRYRLANLDLNTYVRANLNTGPYPSGVYTYTVTGVDPSQNAVYVMDGSGIGSILQASIWDRDILLSWQPGDNVVVGVNDDWLGYWNMQPYLLINADTLTHVRAVLTY